MPAKEALHREFSPQGLAVVGVSIGETPSTVWAFREEFGITYPNGRDPQSRIAIDYGVYGIPETFFIDREGRITYKHIGALGAETLVQKLGEASQGIVSSEGRGGGYQSVR
ncbi:MAG: TlpA family protein disulfide reductase [candidate division NC10 bacterium]|nr:TlpA family protein disulfide reductase [candidate division NC10 bacterium]